MVIIEPYLNTEEILAIGFEMSFSYNTKPFVCLYFNSN